MKILNYSISFVFIVLLLTGCKKDNYDAPSSQLTGRFLYNGELIHVEYNRVPYELFQYGYGRVGPINGVISPEGTYSQLLFDGEYKFVIRPGQGPFIWGNTGGKPDTITIQVNGNTTRDIEVTPFYMIRTPNFTHTATNVASTFKIEKIITGADAKNIERAALFINKTIFVGVDNNIARADITGANITDPNNVSLNVNVPNISPSQNYVFARIGVKAAGVEDWIFTPVQKIQF
jgi:hypothetical protein